jgi:hypothetical protein
MRRCFNGVFQDLAMMMIKLYLNFNWQGCELMKDGSQSITADHVAGFYGACIGKCSLGG